MSTTPAGPVTAASPDTIDPDSVTALVHAARDADGFPSLSDRARFLLETSLEPATTVLTARQQANGVLVGLALLDRSECGWSLEVVVHPAHRVGTLFARLTNAALDVARARGGGRIGAWSRGAGNGAALALRRAGLRPDRTLLQLRAPLDAANLALTCGPVPQVFVRPFRPGVDDAAWLEVNRRAFSGHPEQATWTPDDLERREREPWFDPAGFLLHTIDGRIAAFCWTKVHRDLLLGEIYVIGVDPHDRGQGLGHALAVAGLAHLAAQGIPTAMLYVEATNEPALALYRSLGFTEHHREVRYVGSLAAQVATPTARPTP